MTGLILPPVINEFKFQGPYLSLGQSIGLLIGAAFWGVGADIWGRKCVFNTVLPGTFRVSNLTQDLLQPHPVDKWHLWHGWWRLAQSYRVDLVCHYVVNRGWGKPSR